MRAGAHARREIDRMMLDFDMPRGRIRGDVLLSNEL